MNKVDYPAYNQRVSEFRRRQMVALLPCLFLLGTWPKPLQRIVQAITIIGGLTALYYQHSLSTLKKKESILNRFCLRYTNMDTGGLLRSEIIEKANVILLGEIHDERDYLQWNAELISHFINGKSDRILFESDMADSLEDLDVERLLGKRFYDRCYSWEPPQEEMTYVEVLWQTVEKAERAVQEFLDKDIIPAKSDTLCMQLDKTRDHEDFVVRQKSLIDKIKEKSSRVFAIAGAGHFTYEKPNAWVEWMNKTFRTETKFGNFDLIVLKRDWEMADKGVDDLRSGLQGRQVVIVSLRQSGGQWENPNSKDNPCVEVESRGDTKAMQEGIDIYIKDINAIYDKSANEDFKPCVNELFNLRKRFEHPFKKIALLKLCIDWIRKKKGK